jgi:hypothetical protein
MEYVSRQALRMNADEHRLRAGDIAHAQHNGFFRLAARGSLEA